ncbi:hypothetical protein ZIOFF_070702 [Zingiber officinale]|uniref:Uncharacterized protein n=1 Tax=Zingiber officinale TaxID=94328 RepID=A0A8J5ET93_ZINOF|nr:hypothetical protein ZIOFF_070702 [Zingiber officinale]
MFSGGSGDEESLSKWMAMLIRISIHMTLVPGEDGGGGASLLQRVKEERFLQWGQQETRDLIAIKADLERDPLAARTLGGSGGQDEGPRLPSDAGPVQEQVEEPHQSLQGPASLPFSPSPKFLLQSAKIEHVSVITNKMGPENLIRRLASSAKLALNLVKIGKETADPGAAGRQWPFFDELSVVFMEHRNDMKCRLFESESGSSQRKKQKRLSSIQSAEESGILAAAAEDGAQVMRDDEPGAGVAGIGARAAAVDGEAGEKG